MTRIAIVLALGLLLPSAAGALCQSATGCLCNNATGVLEVVVTAVDGPRTKTRVAALHGETGAWKADDLLTLPRDFGDAANRRLLVHLFDGEARYWQPVTADGFVECVGTDPLFRIAAADAVAAALDADCQQALYERGFKEPECNDSGGVCGTAAAVAPGVLGLLAFAIRRRARRHC